MASNVPVGDPSLIVDVEQGTEEWHLARLGIITGSKMKDVIAWKIKKQTKAEMAAGIFPEPEEKAERIMYRKTMVSERLIGILGEQQVYVNEAMRWGSANESIARTTYELQMGKKVQQIGMIKHPFMRLGYSPDGLVGDDGMIEVKCLEPWNHLYNIVKLNDMPDDYKPQVQMGMWLLNRQWCDFIGYDSREAPGLDLFAVRVERDQDYIDYLEEEADKFLKEVERDLRYYMQYLPTCKRICRACGAYFVDKLPICPECKQNNSQVDEVVEPAERSLKRIEAMNVR